MAKSGQNRINSSEEEEDVSQQPRTTCRKTTPLSAKPVSHTVLQTIDPIVNKTVHIWVL